MSQADPTKGLAMVPPPTIATSLASVVVLVAVELVAVVVLVTFSTVFFAFLSKPPRPCACVCMVPTKNKAKHTLTNLCKFMILSFRV